MPSIQPSGDFLRTDSGVLEGRVFRQSGHIALVGPDLNGAPLANSIILAPPAGRTAAGPFQIGPVLASTTLSNGLELTQAAGSGTIVSRLTFPHEGVMRYEVVDWRGLLAVETFVEVASDAGEHFYGFGEKFNSFDQAGKHVHMLTFDQPATKGDHSYKVSPWFVSTRGYGFHLDSSAESTFDMRAAAPDRYVVKNLFSSLKFNVVYGPKLTDVLTRFTGYTGRPALPPPWAFGAWISSDIWRDGGEIRYAVTKFRERGIPVSAFVFDSPWEVAYNDFAPNLAQFGRPGTFEGVNFPGFASVAELMQFLQKNGLKVICWMTPFINTDSMPDEILPRQHPRAFVPGQNLGHAANYRKGADNKFFVRRPAAGPSLVVPWWKGHGSPVDFTNPLAAKWFVGQLKALLTASDVTTASGGQQPAIGGFKTDDGETTNGANIYIPVDAVYADGRTGVEMRNAYCLEYQKTVWNVLGKDGLLFARSGFVGSQAFPGHWAGDNEPNFGDNGLPGVIVAGLSAAMSGYSIWGHDVGGYQNSNPSLDPANLFMRWAQFGCFSPIMQMHRQVDKNNQYPWNFGPEALQNYQFFADLHTRLFPYTYTYATQSSATGVPIMRPLVLLNQTDPNTFGLAHTYCFGNEFLVAPIITPNATQRQVYLPAGAWFDFWTSERHAGGQSIVWNNPNQMQFPLFVREGAIIPMLPGGVQTLCDADYVNNPLISTPPGDLQLLIYPAADSNFTVFDGTAIRCQTVAQGVTINLASVKRKFHLNVFGTVQPQRVSADAVALAHLGTAAALAGADSGWFHDPAANFTTIKFPHGGLAPAMLALVLNPPPP